MLRILSDSSWGSLLSDMSDMAKLLVRMDWEERPVREGSRFVGGRERERAEWRGMEGRFS